MNKKTFIILTVFFIFAVTIFLTPPKASAVIANYEETITAQQDSADTVVHGTVIGVNYITYFTNSFKGANYDLFINKVTRGHNLKVGDIVTLNYDCSQASEMVMNISIIDCFRYSPKIGNNQTMYFNFGYGSGMSQAEIYGNDVVGVNMIINSITCTLLLVITIIGTIVIIVKTKRKKFKPSKENDKNQDKSKAL